MCAARALLLRPESPRVWALVVVATIGLRGLEGGCMVLQAAQQRFSDDPMFVRTMLAGGVCVGPAGRGVCVLLVVGMCVEAGAR